MLIKEILTEYKESPETEGAAIRGLGKYFFDKCFRLRIKIYRMLNTKNRRVQERRRWRIFKNYGCDISPGVKIGRFFHLPHPAGVVIGKGTVIGDNCVFYQNVTLGSKDKKHYPAVGNGVKIYPSSVVFGDIKIGDGAVIGAGAVVFHDVAPGSTVAGNPAVEIHSGK